MLHVRDAELNLSPGLASSVLQELLALQAEAVLSAGNLNKPGWPPSKGLRSEPWPLIRTHSLEVVYARTVQCAAKDPYFPASSKKKRVGKSGAYTQENAALLRLRCFFFRSLRGSCGVRLTRLQLLPDSQA